MRSFHSALAVVIALLFSLSGLQAKAASPNFSGTWQLDAAKSQVGEGQVVTLTIQSASGKINLERVVQDKDGKQVKSTFSCEIGGNSCDFDENGHKAKVSLWFNGPALQILKTDGPKEDAVTQWNLQLSPNGHTLTVEFDYIDPADKKKTMVFDKKAT